MTIQSTVRALALGIALVFAGAIANAWELAVNGRPGSDSDAGLAVALDPQTGAVFVGENRATTSGSSSFAVVKLNAAGTNEWQHVVRTTADGDDRGSVTGLALDPAGFLFAAGWVGNGSSVRLVLIKFDGRSRRKRVLWTREIPVFGVDVNDIRVTPDGGVALAATFANVDGSTSFYLMKFASDGQDAWTTPRTLSGTAHGISTASALAVLPNGDIAAAGTLANAATGNDAVVARFDGSTGETRWLTTFNDPVRNGDDFGTGIDVTPDGDVVAAASMVPVGAGVVRDFTVIRLTGTGGIRWRQSVHRGQIDSPVAVAIAPDGDVIACGRVSSPGGSQRGTFFVASLRADSGVERWHFAEIGANDFLEARDIAFDASGNPVITGFGLATNALSAFTVVALDRDGGGVVWDEPIAGTAPLLNQGNAIVSNPMTNVIVAVGVTQNERTSLDTTVTHITDGREDWRRVMTGRGKRFDRRDVAFALALHPRNGTLVMAGYMQNNGAGLLGEPTDLALVKIRKNGTQAWKYHDVDAQLHVRNAALAVAVSPGGEVFAGGQTCGTGPSCFTVVGVDKRGREAWRTTIGDVGDRAAASFVAVDPQDGNVIAAGIAPGGLFTVVKLDAASGAVIWMARPSGSPAGVMTGLMLGSRGTVAVATLRTIYKFNTTDGTLMSTVVVPLSVMSMAVDPRDGSIVAGGVTTAGEFSTTTAVAKIDATGGLLWSLVSPPGTLGAGVNTLAVDPNTGAIAAANSVAIWQLDADGTERWRSSGVVTARGVAFAGGMVVAVGQATVDRRTVFAVQALEGGGTEAWRRTFPGTANFGSDSGQAVIVDAARGAVYAVGFVTNAGTGSDMFAVGLTFEGLDLPGALETDETAN